MKSKKGFEAKGYGRELRSVVVYNRILVPEVQISNRDLTVLNSGFCLLTPVF